LTNSPCFIFKQVLTFCTLAKVEAILMESAVDEDEDVGGTDDPLTAVVWFQS